MSATEFERLELLAEIDALVDRLNRWADDAPDWRPARTCQALARRLADRADALRIRLEAPLVAATLGGTGTGKRALVNAIVGDEVVQTGRARPTTTRPTLISRPDLTPEALGIDPAAVEWIPSESPALRDLVLIDCPDPDTTEEPLDGGNLARLRAVLPKCDVLLVTATQQKYRSARVSDELAAAARGAHVVFVQTHADLEDDIRDDWRRVLKEPMHIFRIDSLRALADAKAGLQPRGEFAELLDLLTRQMAGAAAARIRRVNFLDLVSEALDACKTRLDAALPEVRQLLTAIDEQRAALSARMAARMRSELAGNRRQWENRLLAQTASRWGLSPFSLVLRIYQGLGGFMTGALLYRARTPAQMALWGAVEGARTWRGRWKLRQADRGVDRVAAAGWDASELHKAAIVVEGHAAEAGLSRAAAAWDAIGPEAESAAGAFVARAASELESLVAELAQRHTGRWTRWRYEFLLLTMLVALLYRAGKNFFFDSWLAPDPVPIYGLEFYLSAGFWLVLWCLLLLWAFCSRLRSGLGARLDRLAEGWRDGSAAAGVFARIEADGRRAEQYRLELESLRQEADRLKRQTALSRLCGGG